MLGLWHVCVACDGYMCGLLCGHIGLKNQVVFSCF